MVLRDGRSLGWRTPIRAGLWRAGWPTALERMGIGVWASARVPLWATVGSASAPVQRSAIARSAFARAGRSGRSGLASARVRLRGPHGSDEPRSGRLRDCQGLTAVFERLLGWIV